MFPLFIFFSLLPSLWDSPVCLLVNKVFSVLLPFVPKPWAWLPRKSVSLTWFSCCVLGIQVSELAGPQCSWNLRCVLLKQKADMTSISIDSIYSWHKSQQEKNWKNSQQQNKNNPKGNYSALWLERRPERPYGIRFIVQNVSVSGSDSAPIGAATKRTDEKSSAVFEGCKPINWLKSFETCATEHEAGSHEALHGRKFNDKLTSGLRLNSVNQTSGLQCKWGNEEGQSSLDLWQLFLGAPLI